MAKKTMNELIEFWEERTPFPRLFKSLFAAKKTKDSSNEEKKFLTEDEIVSDVLGKIVSDPVALKQWLETKKKDLVSFHFNVGMRIRNMYHLWHPENPNTIVNPKPNSRGIVDHPLFPDQVSQRIIEKVWKKLQKNKEVVRKKLQKNKEVLDGQDAKE